MVNIPLSVYTATEATRVARKEFLHGHRGRGRPQPDPQGHGRDVSNADVIRMAQADNGAWVILTDDEIAACTSPRGLAEVVSFVPNAKTAPVPHRGCQAGPPEA